MPSRQTSPLPKSLQDLLIEDEEEMEWYGDYEDHWITAAAQSNPQVGTDPEPSQTKLKTGITETESKTAGQEGES
ncbi:hypothetical protein P168DRAFT_328096 [Aspergillus campestris IBT 28561]|uniref:Uncharacterized protein n=1 Tax=Aspergillus campestris (strain IBT 28561) TaxID=1392248 RepID=A0A2I1CZE3_ASPC2|nr:uncharacterized protein P168DRAFT_328096 [Aspergillus campestris IBT 28561]PKY02995.1 hypothetical protein P168DRAFT_328096 [Aspergillus campestris IBT 28561]